MATAPDSFAPAHPVDLLVIGGSGIDLIVPVPQLPLPIADSVHTTAPIREYVAHTGNGVALGALAAGLTVRFLDIIGDDREGAAIRAHHAAHGLEAAYAISAAGTRRSVNLVDGLGRRLSLYDGRDPAAMRLPDALLAPALATARRVHVSIMDWARHVLPQVRAAGVPLSVDLHDWDGNAAHHRDFALQADTVFLSGAALGGDTGTVPRHILQQGRAHRVVVMDGERGSLAWERGASVPHTQAALTPPGPVIDTNGAGDSYVAAFLAGEAAGLPLAACMRLGARAGAFACTVAGTHERFLDRACLFAESD